MDNGRDALLPIWHDKCEPTHRGAPRRGLAALGIIMREAHA